MLDKLLSFVENGGRIEKNREPRFGEPFYHDYIRQFIASHYKPGDKVRLQEETSNGECKIYEGVIISIDYSLELLTSGKKVYKNKQNKKDFQYGRIRSIEMIQSDNGAFDLSAVDIDTWNWKNREVDDANYFQEKTEQRRKQRLEDQREFNQVYPAADFDSSHVIRINDGCGIYWPFECNSFHADIYLVRGKGDVTPIPCKIGTPFPNKNWLRAYNYKGKDKYPDLYVYLPDNGSVYKDISIVCIWTIHTTISKKNSVIKVVNIHHIEELRPIEDEQNMVIINMSENPLLGYGKALFTDSSNASLLERMMDKDMYFVLNVNEDFATMIKTLESQTEEDLQDYLFLANAAINDFDIQKMVEGIVNNQEEYIPLVEVFCNIDQSPERYYSSSWYHSRKEYQFKINQE